MREDPASRLRELALGCDRLRSELPVPPAHTSSLAKREVQRPPRVRDVLQQLAHFPDCVGYASHRRSCGVLDLSKEEGVQDLVYFMLRSSIPDLVPEQPVSGPVRQYSIQDFRSLDARLVIEAKRVRSASHARSIKSELNDDIGNYKNDLACDDLIFVIYDPENFLESPAGLCRAVEGEHRKDAKALRVHCLVF